MRTQRRQSPNSGRQGKTKACLYRQGLTFTIGGERGAEHSARQEAGTYRSRMRKLAWRLMARQDFLKMESSFPVTVKQKHIFFVNTKMLETCFLYCARYSKHSSQQHPHSVCLEDASHKHFHCKLKASVMTLLRVVTAALSK